MELSAKYAYQVYKEKSFSSAAKALQVSQPALSAAVSRLEKELDIRIFDRSKIPLTLTSQGIIYIQAVEEMLQSERMMQQRLRQLSDMRGGKISIGYSGSGNHFWLSRICGEFHKRYPDVQLCLQMDDGSLFEKLADNALDLVMSYSGDESRFINEAITEDRLFIAARKDMPGVADLQHLAISLQDAIRGGYGPEREVEDLSLFSQLPFIPWEAHSDLAKRMHRMLGSFKSAFCHVSAGSGEMQYDLMNAGLGAAVVTSQMLLSHKKSAEDLLLFALKSEDAKPTVYLSGRYSGADQPIIRNFIQVAKESCSKFNETICL